MKRMMMTFGAFVFCLLVSISPATASVATLINDGQILEDVALFNGSAVNQNSDFRLMLETNVTGTPVSSYMVKANITNITGISRVANASFCGYTSEVYLGLGLQEIRTYHVTNYTWTEETAVGTSSPISLNQYDTTIQSTTNASAFPVETWLCIDVTDGINNDSLAGKTNTSFWVNPKTETAVTDIYIGSKETTTLWRRPYLTINYFLLASLGGFVMDSPVASQLPTTLSVNATIAQDGDTLSSAYLNYNGTRYLYDTAVNYTNVLTISKTITPTVAALANMSVFWELYYNSNGTVQNINSTPVNQTVYVPYVGACGGSYAQSKRLVFLNETSPFAPANASFEAYLELSSAGGTYNYSFSGSNNTAWVCISPTWASYDVDGQIRYTGNDSGEYESRDYFLDNATFDNVTEDLNLYQTPVATADHFTVQVQDQYSSPYANAIVQVQRWYPELGAYKIVAAPKTNTQGQASTYLTLYDVYYRFVVSYDGETIYTSAMSPITTSVTETYLITISPGEIMSWLKYHGKVSGACSFSNATNLLSCSYSDTSGDMDSVSLTVYQQGALTSSLVCTATNTTAGTGVLSCDLGATTGKIMEYKLVMTLGSVEMALATGGLNTGFESTMLFGNCRLAENALACKEGLIVAFFLVLIVAMVGMFHPGAAVIMAMSALTFTWYVGLVAISAQTVVGLIFVAAVLIYRMRD